MQQLCRNRVPVKTLNLQWNHCCVGSLEDGLVFLAFSLHVGTEASGSHFKEMKPSWRLYKFCASNSLCTFHIIWLFCFAFFLLFILLSPILETIERVLFSAWIVSLISAVPVYSLGMPGTLKKKFLWGSRRERVLILRWKGDRTCGTGSMQQTPPPVAEIKLALASFPQ